MQGLHGEFHIFPINQNGNFNLGGCDNLNIDIECDNNIKIKSYPGAISQIISNLIINSIHHAFKEKEKCMIFRDFFK